ncbi:MAG: MinD/ParA family protein [Rhodocyclaceae bacterium]
MVSLFDDQAAGLRKLFAAARGPATAAFAGSGGCGALVAGLAHGLAAAGKDVLVIDEQAGADTVAAAFGLRSRYDLLQAVNRDVPAAQVLLRPEPSIRLLPAARAARRCARLDAMARRALAGWLRRQQQGADFVLVNAGAGADFSPLLPQPQRIVIALSAGAPSLTEAYARMKRLTQLHGRRRFGVVLLAADVAEGRTVFDNLHAVARRHLGAELELLGGAAAASGAEARGRLLAEAFLGESPQPSSGSRAPAAFHRHGAKALHPVV